MKLSELLASKLDLVVLDGYSEITGRGFVDIETHSDYDVGLYGLRLARVTKDHVQFDDKALEEEASHYQDETLETIKDSLRPIIAAVKLERGWK